MSKVTHKSTQIPSSAWLDPVDTALYARHHYYSIAYALSADADMDDSMYSPYAYAFHLEFAATFLLIYYGYK